LLATEIHDFSTSVTGNWLADLPYIDVAGTAQAYLDLNSSGGEVTTAITGATNATPIVIHDVAHGYTSGDEVLQAGVGGNTNANGRFLITKTDADHYSLQYLNGQDVPGNGSYTSGGTASRWVWSRFNSLSAQGTAQFARLRIQTSGAMEVTGLGDIKVSVVSRKEPIPGPITTSNSAAKVIYLNNFYNKAVSIEGTVIGTTAAIWVADQVEVANDGIAAAPCIRFGGTSEYASRSSISSLGQNVTFEGWYYITSVGANGAMLWDFPTDAFTYHDLWLGSDGFLYNNTGDAFTTPYLNGTAKIPIPIGHWVFFSVVHDHTVPESRLYLNGVYAGTATYRDPTSTSTGRTYVVGADHAHATYFMTGKFYEFRVWNEARSLANIQANMRSRIGTSSNLKIWLKTDEATSTTLNDSSGNGLTFTVSGSPAWRPINGFDLYTFDAAGAQISASWLGSFSGI
jgi:hypothetical protein